MRKLLLSALVLVAAPLAHAQETYSGTYPAAQVARLNRVRVALNDQTCNRVGLAPGCTQAQACVAANATGGAACTNGQAKAANARIYADSQPDREDLVFNYFALSAFKATERQLLQGPEASVTCNWFNNVASQAERDARCVQEGNPAGCNPCP